MNYVEQLEKQNEELQQKLAEAIIWKPVWKRDDNDHWRYVRGPCTYASVSYQRGEFVASWYGGSNEKFNKVEDAKAHVELYVSENLRNSPA